MGREPYADMTRPPPPTMRCDFQPYGPYTIADTSWGSYNGYPSLTGRVVIGCATSYMGGHRSTRSIVGEFRTIWGVTQREADEGRCIRVAM